LPTLFNGSESREQLWDVYEALIRLGYNGVEARAAIKMVPDDIKDAEKKLKEALKNLGR